MGFFYIMTFFTYLTHKVIKLINIFLPEVLKNLVVEKKNHNRHVFQHKTIKNQFVDA